MWIGKEAVPGLVRFLSDPNQDRKRKKLVVSNLSQMARHHGPKEIQDAIPILVALLSNADLRIACVDALENIGPLAKTPIPALQQLAKEVPSSDRVLIGICLYRIERTEPDVLPLLLDGLQHKDKQTRKLAATGLGEMGTDARQAIPMLMRVLKDEDAEVRMGAAYALGDIGSASQREVLDALQQASKDSDPYVRDAAVQATERIRSRR